MEKEEYFLAFFLTGAYQEVLGMNHNLFSHPTEAIVKFNKNGDFYFEKIVDANNLLEILDDIGYDISTINKRLKSCIEESNLIDDEQKQNLLGKLYFYLSENSYLKTIQASKI